MELKALHRQLRVIICLLDEMTAVYGEKNVGPGRLKDLCNITMPFLRETSFILSSHCLLPLISEDDYLPHFLAVGDD